MMHSMMMRAESIARAGQRRKLHQVAEQLRNVLNGASVEVEEARVLVRGRGMVKRWLIDPSLRFLSGGLK
ncbi:MAG TPA: hypothetical protein VFY95_06890 [Sphingomicrobium sp.]